MKVKYHINKDTNKVVKVVKHGDGRTEYQTMSKDEYENEQGIAGCIGFIVIAIIIILIIIF